MHLSDEEIYDNEYLSNSSLINCYTVYSMEKELMKSLQKGLPYPIIKVIEYLSVDRAGFTWGRQYRLAGYYTLCLLWLFSFLSFYL